MVSSGHIPVWTVNSWLLGSVPSCWGHRLWLLSLWCNWALTVRGTPGLCLSCVYGMYHSGAFRRSVSGASVPTQILRPLQLILPCMWLYTPLIALGIDLGTIFQFPNLYICLFIYHCCWQRSLPLLTALACTYTVFSNRINSSTDCRDAQYDARCPLYIPGSTLPAPVTVPWEVIAHGGLDQSFISSHCSQVLIMVLWGALERIIEQWKSTRQSAANDNLMLVKLTVHTLSQFVKLLNVWLSALWPCNQMCIEEQLWTIVYAVFCGAE